MTGEELHFSSCLYRIALNMVRSEWRRRKHVTILPFSMSQGSDALFTDAGEDVLIGDDQFEERVVQRDLVRHVLAQLPDSSAMCLLLDAEGFSYNEIAAILHDSLPAVRSRLSRARQAFQRIYRSLDKEGKR
jgi:RNA polymerase sigma-70 factor (ECF subfamily)